jgi:hypothetical protein
VRKPSRERWGLEATPLAYGGSSPCRPASTFYLYLYSESLRRYAYAYS